MRTEGDFIKINECLIPLSWIYGLGVRFRNLLFDTGVLKSRCFDVPVISVGNITVGGSGKTPHVEYLVRLLHRDMKVAVLSRGYKRKSHGYVLAAEDTPMRDIGDEPYQIKHKFEDVVVAVDRNRCHGIDCLLSDEQTHDVDVILLDDAFQHRYVRPGINILLVDYHRLIIYDRLLPAGRLREPKEGTSRADIVIVTKCPHDLNPMEFRVLRRAMNLFPYQDMFFTTIDYCGLRQAYGKRQIQLGNIGKSTNVLLLTGIASPQQLIVDVQPYVNCIVPMSFGDHHAFTKNDLENVSQVFESMSSPKIIITTEKDSVRLKEGDGLSKEAKDNLFILPIEVKFMQDGEEIFNEKIISYVRKNSRNSILAKAKDDHSS